VGDLDVVQHGEEVDQGLAQPLEHPVVAREVGGDPGAEAVRRPSAAEDDADDGAANGSPQVSAAEQGWDRAAVAAPHAAFAATPVAVVDVVAAPASPFAAAPASAPTFTPTPAVDYGSSSGDEELSTGGKGGVIVVALLVLVGLGGGGWWYLNRTQAEVPKPTAPVGEARVIGASEIPPDTQDPNVAKGGAADRTPAQIIKERAAAEEARRPRPSGTNAPSKPREPEKPTRGPIKVGTSDDPLAGVK
jgi:hypothetical protein